MDSDGTIFCQPTKCLFTSHPQGPIKKESNFLAPLVACEIQLGHRDEVIKGRGGKNHTLLPIDGSVFVEKPDLRQTNVKALKHPSLHLAI